MVRIRLQVGRRDYGNDEEGVNVIGGVGVGVGGTGWIRV